MPRRSRTSSRPFTPRAAGLKIRRRYHFGTPGVTYAFVTLLVALGAFNSQNNLLFWAFGFALALLIVSGVLSGAMLMGLEVVRESAAATPAYAGGPARLTYRVRNTNRLVPAFALTIEEAGPPPRQARRGAKPGWAEQLAPAPRAFVIHAGPGDTLRATATTGAAKRGLAGLTGVTVSTSFPFGLIRKSLEFPQPGTLLVRPRVHALRHEVLAGGRAAGESQARSRRGGQGEEFFALRDYVPGDSPRSIAWRASARRGHLLVKQTSAPLPHRMWIVLRLRATKGAGDEAEERAISLAASLVARAAADGMEIGLAVPLNRVLMHPAPGRTAADRLLDALARVDLAHEDDRGRLAPFPAAATGRGALTFVVHAGPADRSYGPRSSQVVHLSTDQFESYISGTPGTATGRLDPPGTPPETAPPEPATASA